MAADNTDEARLLAIYRAIAHFDNPQLVSPSDVGAVKAALESVVGFDELEKDYSAKEIRAFLAGAVAGIGATELSNYELVPQDEYYQDPDEETEFTGGPTGGVAVGQGTDPRLVTQTGVRAEEAEKDNK